MKEIEIKFGNINPALHEQLIKQGLKCRSVDHFEKLRQSVNFLQDSGYLTNGAASKICKKIFDRLFKELEIVRQNDASID